MPLRRLLGEPDEQLLADDGGGHARRLTAGTAFMTRSNSASFSRSYQTSYSLT